MKKSQRNVGRKNAVRDLQKSVEHYCQYTLGKHRNDCSTADVHKAASLAIRQSVIDGMIETERRYHEKDVKRLYYISMEFLMGRSLRNNVINLGADATFSAAMEKSGVDLDQIFGLERDAALGNGGLGRLAACFLDSLATMDMPAYGYGINYEFGLFRQKIHRGYQQEQPDHWLAEGKSIWQIERPDEACVVPLYGRIEHATDRDDNYNPMWLDWKVLIGVPHDMPVVGYGARTVNRLRLYSARASDEFEMAIFNDGDYFRAVEQKIASETVSKVLYPTDSMASGKELRLVQEYFMVACTLRDIFRRYFEQHSDLERFPDKVAMQLNDTHPALAVAELMRLFVDEYAIDWDGAWEMTQATCGYTNHTLLPEALEKWPVSLIEYVLPRHMQIIYEINHRFLKQVDARWPNDDERKRRMSIIEETAPKQVRMAFLSIVGSHSVNGVAALHSELVKSSLVPDFYEMWPERFSNKTNGITQRRWLLMANPKLAQLVTDTIGDNWITDLDQLRKLASVARDRKFQKKFALIKLDNKRKLARLIYDQTRVQVNPESIFDIQAKRIHEYKRQLLNALHIIHQYLSIVEDGVEPAAPRTYIFAGKAAPGYWTAKLIIKLINNIAQVVNNDPRVNDLIKVVFLADYCVSLAESLIPAADLSEQISTAGKEASGTGNMKFALNGALTIGTLDGANVEIRDEVGHENIYIFGLTVDEISELRNTGGYNPWSYYGADKNLHRVLESLSNNTFSANEPGLFNSLYDDLLQHGDTYFLLADFDSYRRTQEKVANDYLDIVQWRRKAILNVAYVGKFSSDRTIAEYARDVWNLTTSG